MKTGLENINGVECLTVKGEEASTGVLFFHGYGANMHDLFPLWQMWHQEKFAWYFPNGVQPLPMGYYEGRAWFSINMEKLEEAMRQGRHRDMTDDVPPELDQTLQQLEAVITEVSKRHQRIVLGGFSQGGMLAYHLGLRSSLPVNGLVLLSTNLVAQSRLPAAAKGLPFYQSHGTQDPVLSVEGARKLEQKLKSMNFHGKLHEFSGGHEIPPSVIQEVKIFLSQFSD